MISKVNINNYISNDNVNLIEIYFINSKNENSINVMTSDKIEKIIDTIYKKNRV